MADNLTSEEINRINESAAELVRKIKAVLEADREPMSEKFFGPFAKIVVDDNPAEPRRARRGILI